MKKLLLISILFLTACSGGRDNFVSLGEVDSSIPLEMRYYGSYNFVGERIDGYNAPKCLLTKEAAEALGAVQRELMSQKLSLRVYDCYRPKRAVAHFVRWAEDISDARMKDVFYPDVDKSNLFQDGYIAKKSGHSRGSVVDLTIDGLNMGTLFDFFSPLSATENSQVDKVALANRAMLKAVMEKHGFVNYEKEWWHYTLKDEPFPGKYFNFVVE